MMIRRLRVRFKCWLQTRHRRAHVRYECGGKRAYHTCRCGRRRVELTRVTVLLEGDDGSEIALIEPGDDLDDCMFRREISTFDYGEPIMFVLRVPVADEEPAPELRSYRVRVST